MICPLCGLVKNIGELEVMEEVGKLLKLLLGDDNMGG